MSVKAALREYFGKLETSRRNRGKGLPRACINEDAEPFIYRNSDDEGWAEWIPLIKTSISRLEPLEDELGVKFPDDLREYFNSYWFCSLEGAFQSYVVHLAPVLPGIELDDFSDWTRRHSRKHGNGWAVLGFDMNSSASLLVNLATGQVHIQSERFSTPDSWPVIAPDIETIINTLDIEN